jgi:hypothetical protein
MHCLKTSVSTAALALLTMAATQACISLGPASAPIAVASESAVIVWNPRTQTESFIRQADFVTNARDFGFLVPTPAPPKLAAANPAIFALLNSTAQQKPPYHTRSKGVPEQPGSVPAAAISVLSTQTVAGYDATVLKATDMSSLDGWLAKRGYAHGKDLRDWLAPYVAKGWAITAFKVHQAAPGKPQARLAPVRMTFHTDTPFYPYREPASARAPGAYRPGRLLRIYFIGDRRMDATLGSAQSWPGYLGWAGDWRRDAAVRQAPLAEVAKECAVAPDQMPGNAWLTVFEDRSSPRPGTADVFFHPARAQTPVTSLASWL